jgi:acetolactate synthase-1/2/3 large subunit
MGPVLIDVPMNVQQEPASEADYAAAMAAFDKAPVPAGVSAQEASHGIERLLNGAERPLAVLGGGLGLAGTTAVAQDWCDAHGIPYIASWAGLTYVDRARPGYQGSHGVYGSRHANWSVNAADRILVLGSRLDNRQRTGDPRAYAPFADVFMVDVDAAEIQKFGADSRYRGAVLDLTEIPEALAAVSFAYDKVPWLELVERDRATNPSGWEASVNPGETNPYDLVVEMQKHFPPDSIVMADTGATVCWLFQAYGPDDSLLFTSGGNSPMGYSLPAAIGAQIAAPEAPVICVIGDGGLQMNLQELQTAVNYALPITIIVFNNAGYGIIKQFQDANTDSRYHASGQGYSAPDFGAIAKAYGIEHHRVEAVSGITPQMFGRGLHMIELIIPPQALITPKVEGDRFVHDQFPYLAGPNRQVMPFDYPDRPSGLTVSSAL